MYSLSNFEQRYDDLYAKQYGKYRIIRIKEAVEKFLECGDYSKGIARIKCTDWHVSHPGALSRYGYQWIILKHQDRHLSRELYIYFASGYGGQSIVFVPELSLVVVITAGNYGKPDPTVDLFPYYVFAAVMDKAGKE